MAWDAESETLCQRRGPAVEPRIAMNRRTARKRSSPDGSYFQLR
jgi:hypothetical protein